MSQTGNGLAAMVALRLQFITHLNLLASTWRVVHVIHDHDTTLTRFGVESCSCVVRHFPSCLEAAVSSILFPQSFVVRDAHYIATQGRARKVLDPTLDLYGLLTCGALLIHSASGAAQPITLAGRAPSHVRGSDPFFDSTTARHVRR